MNVELRHLRALVALAESDTFTTAAAVLGTTQPTLSRTIAQLEEITATALVERTTRDMVFTAAGWRFAAQAADVLARLEGALADLHNESAWPLRLGWACAGLGRHTVPLLQQWKQSHALPVDLRRPVDPLEAIRRNEIDAAIVRDTPTSQGSGPDLDTSVLFTEELVAAVAANDHRARRTTISLSDLAQDPIAICATAPTVTSRLWRPLGHIPRTITVAGTEEWLTRIGSGDAVGVTAAATAYNHPDPDVTYLPIEDSPHIRAVLVWPRADPHPQAGAFGEFARDYFTNIINTASPPMILLTAQGRR